MVSKQKKWRHILGFLFSAVIHRLRSHGLPQPTRFSCNVLPKCHACTRTLQVPSAPSPHHHLLTIPRRSPRPRAKGKPALRVDLVGALGSETLPSLSQAGCSWNSLQLGQTAPALGPRQGKDNVESSTRSFPSVVWHLRNSVTPQKTALLVISSLSLGLSVLSQTKRRGGGSSLDTSPGSCRGWEETTRTRSLRLHL